MEKVQLNIMLVDDDIDDCNFFKEALDDMHLCYNLGVMHDGKNLINYLTASTTHLPDILFLDLNMPHKNGIECLSDLKENEKLAAIPVIMYSSSCTNQSEVDNNLTDMFLSMGALGYIRKTNELAALKAEIQYALNLATDSTNEALPPSSPIKLQDQSAAWRNKVQELSPLLNFKLNLIRVD